MHHCRVSSWVENRHLCIGRDLRFHADHAAIKNNGLSRRRLHQHFRVVVQVHARCHLACHDVLLLQTVHNRAKHTLVRPAHVVQRCAHAVRFAQRHKAVLVLVHPHKLVVHKQSVPVAVPILNHYHTLVRVIWQCDVAGLSLVLKFFSDVPSKACVLFGVPANAAFAPHAVNLVGVVRHGADGHVLPANCLHIKAGLNAPAPTQQEEVHKIPVHILFHFHVEGTLITSKPLLKLFAGALLSFSGALGHHLDLLVGTDLEQCQELLQNGTRTGGACDARLA